MAAGSPYLSTLPLAEHGLRWLHHPAPLAHPLDDGTAVTLERNLGQTTEALGVDGKAWRRIMEPLAENWTAFSSELLGPILHMPQSPLLLAHFGIRAAWPVQALARGLFRSPRTRALLAGLGAHSFLSLDAPFSAAVAIALGAAAHAVGWPIPGGGAQSITDALISLLQSHGGSVHTSSPVFSLQIEPFATESLTLCDLAPGPLVKLAGERLPANYRRTLEHFRAGPGAFKIDYALSEPIPWQAADCRRASTVHLGGTIEEVAHSEAEMTRGRIAVRPFVLLSQPTLVDPTRAPAGRHIAWAYCHVPNGFSAPEDSAAETMAVERVEAQIERFAPGFRECILARTVSSPAALETSDANLVGGDISGGAMTLSQLLFRPSWRSYRTPDPRLFLCSASTPPGAGVHGMCGFHAAQAALRSLR
jgi:phytoene dehydrogenase-like protein